MTGFADYCASEEKARLFIISKRWPEAPVCTHCNQPGKVYELRGGGLKCASCRRKFTVAGGTVFEDSRIPLHKWLRAIELMCRSREGVNAADLQRALELRSYRSALFMVYRIEWALEQKPFRGMWKK